MRDLSCLLAGILRLSGMPLLLYFWHRKTGARFYPALTALVVCFPVFIFGGFIRSNFSQEDFIAYYLSQGILYGILEEGAKFLVLRYLLPSCDRRQDAVSYGIGHAAFEEIGAGISCLGLIGTDRAAPDIFWFALLTVTTGALGTAALTLLIFYGIRTGRAKCLVPLAMLLHCIGNASQGLFSEPFAILTGILLTASECYAAYRCWRDAGAYG